MVRQTVDDRAAPPTCVWMDAGLITYRLCDRNFDCEQCPLDAALRGLARPRPVSPGLRRATGTCQQRFPEDRRYCGGHTWLRPLEADGRLSFGIDGFAASLMAPPEGFRATALPRFVHRGQSLCEVVMEHGSLALSAPFDASIVRWNGSLKGDPEALVSAPYGDGWIVELRPAEGEGIQQCQSSDIAAESARLDFRRFLRRVGQELLLEGAPRQATLSNGHPATDLRWIIRGPQYLQILREFIH